MKNTKFATYLEKPVAQKAGSKAKNTIDFGETLPKDGNYIKLNGVQYTFKNDPVNNTDIKIGPDVSTTIDNLLANKSLPSTVTLSKVDPSKLLITYKDFGTAGNEFTLGSDYLKLDKSLIGGLGDPDWSKLDAQVNFKTFELLVNGAETTEKSLSSYNYNLMKKGNKVLLVDSDNNVIPHTLSDVTESGILQTFDMNHIGSKINLDSTKNIAVRDSSSATSTQSQIYGNVIDKGNVYWEAKILENESKPLIGISKVNDYQDNYFAKTTDGYGYYYDGTKYNDGKSVSYGKSYDNNDRIGVRYCYETGEVEFFKNGVSQGIAFVLDKNTKVYPAIRLYSANAKAQLFSDPKTMKYLPKECVPYGMLKYSTDLTSAKLTKAPVKAFMDHRPMVFVSMEDDVKHLVQLTPENKKPVLDSSTNSTLNTDDLKEGEELYVNGKKTSVTKSNLNIFKTVQSKDPLGDNSQVTGYNFADGLTKSMNGSKYDCQWGQINGIMKKGMIEAGKFGNAAKFDGNTMLELPMSIFSELETYAVSMWIKTTQTDSPTGLFSYRGSGNNDVESILYLNRKKSGDIGTDISNGKGVITYVTDNINSNDGKYHHIVNIIDFANKKVKVYFDNQLVIDEFNDTIKKEGTPDKVYIGSNHGNQKFKGAISQVRVFNKNLSPADVAAIFKEQIAKFNITELGLPDAPNHVFSKGYVELNKVSSDDSSFASLSKHGSTLKKGDKVLTDKGVVPVTDTPTTEIASLLDNADPLSDGSQITGYNFSKATAKSMNGTTYDGVWKNANGKEITGIYAPGKFGTDTKAAKFDGTKGIDVHKANFSKAKAISLWINWNGVRGSSATSNWATILSSKVIDQPQNNQILVIHKNKLSTYNKATQQVIWDTELKKNEWYFITINQNAEGNYDYYINGKPVNLNLPDNNATLDLYFIGSDNKSGKVDEPFTGLIDQVRVFNRELDPDDIKTIFSEQATKYNIPLPKQDTAYTFAAVLPKTIEMPLDKITFDGTKFTSQHLPIEVPGRALQRRIVMPEKGITVLPPFTSNMWKKGI